MLIQLFTGETCLDTLWGQRLGVTAVDPGIEYDDGNRRERRV